MTVTVDGRVYNFHSNTITIEYSDILASAASDTGNVVVDGLSIPWRVFWVRPMRILFTAKSVDYSGQRSGDFVGILFANMVSSSRLWFSFAGGVATLLTTIAATL